jgi:hypothetical protein
MGINIAGWGTIAATIAALIAMAAIYLFARPAQTAPDNRVFIRSVSIGLTLLSVVAIVWETVPVFLVPGCG